MNAIIRKFGAVFATLALVVLVAAPGAAVREGSAQALPYAERYEESGDFQRAALWRAAAVELLERISLPFHEEIAQFQKREKDEGGLQQTRAFYETEIAAPLKASRAALKRDQARAGHQSISPAALAEEEDRIEAFTLRWILTYPDRFFSYGFYRQIRTYADTLAAAGKPQEAVEREAQAREMCARQYQDVVVRYLTDRVGKFRQAGKTAEENRYARLARHYQRLADGELRMARELRTHREEVARYLSDQGSVDVAARRLPVLRRLAADRAAAWNRATASGSALEDPSPRVRLAALRYAIRSRDVEALFAAQEARDAGLHGMAGLAVTAWRARGDLMFIRQLVAVLPHTHSGNLARAHQLLREYANDRGLPQDVNSERDDEVRKYWQSWWERSLRPGVAVTYFRDAGCHVPLATGMADRPGSGRFGSLPEAAAARWETVIDVREEGAYLFSLARQGVARLWVDGRAVEIIDSGLAADGQEARVTLKPGHHAVRLEFAPSAERRRGPELTIIPIIPSTAAAPITYLRHERPS